METDAQDPRRLSEAAPPRPNVEPADRGGFGVAAAARVAAAAATAADGDVSSVDGRADATAAATGAGSSLSSSMWTRLTQWTLTS